jgi:REP element-mobilizing transposase RayT
VSGSEKLSIRKHLPHEIPSWVSEEATFFITIGCKLRDKPQLTLPAVSRHLLSSAEHYHDTGKWWLHLFLLMPDHLHALIIFPRDVSMRRCITSWKSWHARKNGIVWQDGFFDHRIRSDGAFQEKAAYIRNNPLRVGLVDEADDWPHVFRGSGRTG